MVIGAISLISKRCISWMAISDEFTNSGLPEEIKMLKVLLCIDFVQSISWIAKLNQVNNYQILPILNTNPGITSLQLIVSGHAKTSFSCPGR
jgi:hypothetical protein